MSIELTSLGELTCRIVGGLERREPPQRVVLLCHGFGAPGDDLVPVASELTRVEPSLAGDVLFVFPEAPLSLAEVPGGRAWWPIDLVALQLAGERGQLRELRQESPPLLPDARRKLTSVIEALRERFELPLSRFVVGGFSQGSMLATDVTLRLPENTGGLVIYSGTLLVEPEWRELAPRHQGLRVLQSHGTIDPLLPFEAAVWLRDLLQQSGAEVEFIEFRGMHTIPRDAVTATARLLRETIAGNESS